MCNVGDDDVNKFMEAPEKLELENKCKKCRENEPNLVLRSKDVYCKNCFLAATTHKFKAFLGKHRFVHPNDRVLIVHKGGHASTSLLHFLRSGLDLTTPKKLKFEPLVLFIENMFGLSMEQRYEILKNIYNEVNIFNFKIYFVSLGNYILNPGNKSINITQNYRDLSISENDKDLHKHITSDANLTTVQDILQIFERKLTLQVAKELKCKSIFTIEIAVDTACQLLTNVSLGRGAHLPFDIGVCDNRDPSTIIIRPLRYFDIKELAFYNFFNNLEPVSFPRATENPYSSIQSLMEIFVRNLQINYPATVATVVRTGDKLGINVDILKNDMCILCNAPKENECESLNSAESTRFSHWVSTNNHNHNKTDEDQYKLQMFNESEKNEYCFACSKIANYISN